MIIENHFYTHTKLTENCCKVIKSWKNKIFDTRIAEYEAVRNSVDTCLKYHISIRDSYYTAHKESNMQEILT